MPEIIRRFTHKNGFKDNVAWIEYYEDRDIQYILNDGNKVKGNAYTLKDMYDLVKEGSWIELTPFKIYSSSAEELFVEKVKPIVSLELKRSEGKIATRI